MKTYGTIFLILGLISFVGIFFVEHDAPAILAVICIFLAKFVFVKRKQQMNH